MRHVKKEIIEDINTGNRKIIKYISMIVIMLVITLFYLNQHNSLVDRADSIKHVHTLVYGLIMIIAIILLFTVFS